jgi:hypothetical protein
MTGKTPAEIVREALEVELRWQDPDTGIVHDLVVHDSTWWTQGGVDFRTMRCGMNVQLADNRTLIKRPGLIAVPWTTTSLPTSCISCIAAVGRGREVEEESGSIGGYAVDVGGIKGA